MKRPSSLSFFLRRRENVPDGSAPIHDPVDAVLSDAAFMTPLSGPDPDLTAIPANFYGIDKRSFATSELRGRGSPMWTAGNEEIEVFVEASQVAHDDPTPSSTDGAQPVATTIDVSSLGQVEILSTEFAMGWAAVSRQGRFVHVFSVLDGEIIGSSIAGMDRDDLAVARQQGDLNAYAFTIVFQTKIPPDKVAAVQIITPSVSQALPHALGIKIDREPALRIFLLGSPRSGTSEMGASLAKVLDLQWAGEGHAAPLFAGAADLLEGKEDTRHNLIRFMARQRFREIAISAAKQAYFTVHSSASFLDKTPGTAMVTAAPFLAECFPDARFIFLRRHPISNILSRTAKFGGSFEEHCLDWAATMDEWLKVRFDLPHYLEIQQEDMMTDPAILAREISIYIGVSQSAIALGESLKVGVAERTGAGLGLPTLEAAGWTAEQATTFIRICAPIMAAYGYTVEPLT